MVSLVLKSKFPILLFWGTQFIQFYNDAYRPSLGQDGKHPRALGQGGPECWPEIWHSFAQPLFDQIASTRESILSEDQLVPIYRNGKEDEAYWTYTYLPVIDEGGQVGGILAIVHETTQKVKTMQALQQSTTDLERSNANLQLFASAASHDLQEPLRKIQQFSELLITDYEPRLEEGADYVKRIQMAAGRMSTLVRDLLTLSQVTTPSQSTSLVALDDCVQGVLTDLELLIQENGAIVTVEALPVVPGSPTQLRQLLQNLLTNALKFQRPGVPPRIGVKARHLTADQLPASVKPIRVAPAYYCLEVSDNGIGFEPQYAERIFEPFQRLHGKDEYAGTGIGLAICQKVVANHGGAITASSQPQQGATFSVYLPA
jgi:signal transduction histidine kinase